MIILIAKRFVSMIFVVIVASFVLFAMLYLIPGNPATLELGSSVSASVLLHLERAMGLNVPWYIRYIHWLGHAVTGNLGNSYTSGYSVSGLIAQRAPVTIELSLGGIIVGLAVGVPLGVLAGLNYGVKAGRVVDVLVAVGIGLPVFWLGIVLQLIFALVNHFLPATGYVPIGQGLWANLQSMILPIATLAVGLAAINIRFVSNGVLDVRSTNLVMAAEALGLRRRTIVRKVLVRNSLIPLMTVIGLQIGYTLGGVVLVEEVFNLPGLGTLLWEAVLSRDYFLIQGVMLLAVGVFAVVNFLVDISYGLVDPRAREKRR